MLIWLIVNLKKFCFYISGSLYRFDKALLSMKVRLETPTGLTLPQKSQTAPVNNIMLSAFSGKNPHNNIKMYICRSFLCLKTSPNYISDVRVSINGILLNNNTEYYGVRAYFFNTLNNGAANKTCPMNQQGYFNDVNAEDKLSSFGFIDRRTLFLNKSDINEYSGNDIWFCGPLWTELSSSDVGVPPSCKYSYPLTSIPCNCCCFRR